MSFLIELHYLPPTDVWSLLSDTESHLILEQHDHYQKGSFRNRCFIAGSHGRQALSIPLVKGKHQAMPARDVRIAWDISWPRTHWRSIVSAYGSAPYFDHYSDSLAPLFEKRDSFLWDWNFRFFEWMREQLRLPGKISFSESYDPRVKSDIRDLRNVLRPSSTVRDMAFCREVPYMQVFSDRYGFLNGLSGLDLLFCSGPQALAILKAMQTIKSSPEIATFN